MKIITSLRSYLRISDGLYCGIKSLLNQEDITLLLQNPNRKNRGQDLDSGHPYEDLLGVSRKLLF